MTIPAQPIDLDAERELIEAATREAGRLALTFYRKTSTRVWTKGENSPVTEADLAVDDFLRRELLQARPDYGWLSEETADNAERLSRRRLFVVDPIDGTRGFVEGIDDWTVSVAVVEDDRPVAGALYNPVADDLYAAEAGRGARLNGRPIRVSGQSRLYGARIAGPGRLAASKALKDAGVRPARWIHSLALRFARVAAGRLDAAVARPDAHDWDLAAADLLVHEAGGRLAAPNGLQPGYNRPDPRHGVLIAGGPELFGLLSAELAAPDRHRE